MSPTSSSDLPSAGSPARAPRQARAHATRERILAAASADFAAVGYHGSSLSRILERDAGVTKGALYFHFASKEAMALAVVKGMSEAYRDLVERAAVEDAALDPLRRAARLASRVQDLLRGSVVARAGVRLAGEGAVGPMWSAWSTHFWEATFTALITEAQEVGVVRGEVDPAAMGRFVTDVSIGAFTTSLRTTGLTDLASRVTHNWEVMFGYLADPSWLAGWRAEGGMPALMRRHLEAGAGGDGGG